MHLPQFGLDLGAVADGEGEEDDIRGDLEHDWQVEEESLPVRSS